MTTAALAAASGLNGLNRAAPQEHTTPAERKAREAAKEFEAVFLTNFLKTMFDGVKSEEGPFGGGHAEKQYRGFMTSEYAKAISEQGGIGIADQVYGEILRMQEAEQ